jgi:hypothetical protein
MMVHGENTNSAGEYGEEVGRKLIRWLVVFRGAGQVFPTCSSSQEGSGRRFGQSGQQPDETGMPNEPVECHSCFNLSMGESLSAPSGVGFDVCCGVVVET